ncbi:Ankyrin repeat-containing domain [Phytophthora cactorum]|nr:Ankyrin repeat-containing domain [Phytophthora cactorum]
MAKTLRRPLPPSPPLLVSVAFVSRQWPRIEALDHRIVARDTVKIQDMEKLQRQALATSAMASAAAGGHIAVLRRLAALFPRSRVTKAVEAAARNGHVEVLQWLHEQQDTLDVFWDAREMLVAFLIDEAARNGDLAMIQWLDSVGAGDECTGLAQCTADVSIKAVAEGHLEILEWLFQHYPEPIPSARLLRIAKRHDLYCVDWLVRTGKAVDYDMW